MKLEFSLQIFEKKNQRSNFIRSLAREQSSSMRPDRRMDDRRTDIPQLTLAFRNFANAPKNVPFFFVNVCLS